MDSIAIGLTLTLVIGAIGALFIRAMFLGKCTHVWTHNSTTTYKIARTGKIHHHVEHYVCTQCLNTKDVRIG